MSFIKFIRIFLLILIIIGIGLLLTQKIWVSKVVDTILKIQNSESEKLHNSANSSPLSSNSNLEINQPMCEVYETDESGCQNKSDHEITTSSKIDVTLTKPFIDTGHWSEMSAVKNGKLLWKLLANNLGHESFDGFGFCSPDGQYAVIYQGLNVGSPTERQVGGGGTILNLETGKFTSFESNSKNATNDNFLGFEKGKAHTGLVVCGSSPSYAAEVLPYDE